MSDRARSEPPDLPNFTFEKWLGGGGFADVFLYRQHRPSRPVAVKVLRPDGLPSDARASFDAEADLMAQVSTHPYIVEIYETAVAPDGRPYLAMQYYPSPHYGQRSRGRGLDLDEVLAVGVRIASAVETAHRAGILHRDIKPANILVSEYNRPGLTDFGIAGTRDGSSAEAQGVTYAYAPPELLASEEPGDERADVYSLAATLYALLAGRAPFEIPNGDNSTRAIAVRTLNQQLPPIGRSDVPQSLELLLQHAMAKRPGDRPAAAAAFARGLQAVEQELRLPPTAFELAAVAAPPVGDREQADHTSGADESDATRSGTLQVVRPEAAAPSVGPASAEGAPPPVSHRAASSAFDPSLLVPEAPAADDTVHREKPAPAPRSEEPSDSLEPGPRRATLVAAGAGVLLVVIGAVIAFTAASGDKTAAGQSQPPPDSGRDALVLVSAPPAPTDLRVTVAGGEATLTWVAGEAREGDTYRVSRVDGANAEQPAVPADVPMLQVPGIAPGEVPCFQVAAERAGRLSEPSAPACAP